MPQMAAETRKPGNVQQVNNFLNKIGRGHLTPLTHCDGANCTTLLSSKKPKFLVISKKGDASQKRLCKACVESLRSSGVSVV